MTTDPVVQLNATPIFWVVRATLPGQTEAHLAAFEDPEDAADHVTWERAPMFRRRRFKQTESLQTRLQAFTSDVRAKAAELPPRYGEG